MSGVITAQREVSVLPDPELLIREARRRRRRRWSFIAGIVAVVVCVTAAIIGLSGGHVATHRPPQRLAPSPPVSPSSAPSGTVQPQRPGSLAVGSNGHLYMADDLSNQILERLPNGTFEVVAGNGTTGFSGDGGAATNAELNHPAGVTFGPDGTLYIADEMNGRIRAVSTAGIITTVAGNGHQIGWVPDGTPALEASLSPAAMTFGPDGLMYVAAQSEVLRLNADGTFTRVLGENSNQYEGVYGIGGPAVDASADDANGLAFDAAGNLYVAGFANKSILMVDPEGVLHQIGSAYPRGTSGLVTAPDGSVLAMGELSVDRLTPQGIQTVIAFPGTNAVSYLGITGFSPDGIAVAADGSLYLDTYYGNGFADESALVAMNISSPQSPSLLWNSNQK